MITIISGILEFVASICKVLELRQYKNISIRSKNISTLKLPLFFITYGAREKVRQFQNWNFI